MKSSYLYRTDHQPDLDHQQASVQLIYHDMCTITFPCKHIKYVCVYVCVHMVLFIVCAKSHNGHKIVDVVIHLFYHEADWCLFPGISLQYDIDWHVTASGPTYG